MTRLIYVTHPATHIDQLIPVAEWHVSEEGRRQLMRLVKNPLWEKVDTIYSSTEPKALRTAEEIVARIPHLKFPIMFGNEDLGEIDRSSTGFLTKEEHEKAIEEFYIHPDSSYRGWETANSAIARTMRVVSHIMDDNVGKTVVIIGHGAVGTLLVCSLKKIPPNIEEDPKRQGCIMEIDWDKKTILSKWIQF